MNCTYEYRNEPEPCRTETLEELERRALLLYTGQTPDADSILERQSSITEDHLDVLKSLRGLAAEMRDALTGAGDLDRFGELLHRGWEMKRSVGCGISNRQIDDWMLPGRPRTW